VKDRIINWRRELHQIPEPSGKEFRTKEYIMGQLKNMGLSPVEVGETGVYADTGKNPKVALRADMDALPIDEENDIPYRSTHPGMMHACGHDAHMAMVLGAGCMLAEEKIPARLIFQPSEETIPGGAKKLIELGVLDGIERIFGLHVDPTLERGKIASRKGVMMACSDEFEVEIKGKGGHGAYPHKTRDPIFISSLIITSLQGIVSRNVSPFSPVVISIGKIEGGNAFNIIPERVKFYGTVRTLKPDVKKFVKERIFGVINGIAGTYGAEARIEYRDGYPALVNHPDEVRAIEEESRGLFEYVEMEHPSMGGEDFSYYLEHVKGAFAFLGIRNEEKGIVYPLHSPRFEVDEEVLLPGAVLLTRLVRRYEDKKD